MLSVFLKTINLFIIFIIVSAVSVIKSLYNSYFFMFLKSPIATVQSDLYGATHKFLIISSEIFISLYLSFVSTAIIF